MPDNEWIQLQANLSLQRLLPRLAARFPGWIKRSPSAWQSFRGRLDLHFARLFGLLLQLYGDRYDFFYHLEELLALALQSWTERPDDLQALDTAREADPCWYQSNQMLGGVCYVDLYAGSLAAIREKILYMKELGLNYLHLMPLFRCPAGENDGGYAISSYREVDPSLGTMEELRRLASDLRHEGISLVLDLVFNHTSNQHEWAQRARAGETEYQDYYLTFPDRTAPAAYEAHLREIFPDSRTGAFTFLPELRRWVWTTFHSYQWDLNYANPAVFRRMAGEMLFLANVGVEVLRLDAVAFTWKKMGTSCENLPEAHTIVRAFNAVARIAAPALLFKSEAIVHPDDVARYISPEECQLSYNPLLMALLWNSLATRETRLLHQALHNRFQIPSGCAWVNYIRCHDDIGWTFSDEDAAQLGINGYDHRQFLNAFYTGRFDGSFARGLPFQENPRTGDARISGTAASLAGLEKALHEETAAEVELAIRRLVLVYGVILTIGGIPLIYLGDEVGTLNDYSFRNDPAKANDSRWAHRPVTDWQKMARRHDETKVEGRLYERLRRLIEVRKSHGAFLGTQMQVMKIPNDHLLGYVRQGEGERILILANFSETPQSFAGNLLRLYGASYTMTDLLTGRQVAAQDMTLGPYDFLCLGC